MHDRFIRDHKPQQGNTWYDMRIMRLGLIKSMQIHSVLHLCKNPCYMDDSVREVELTQKKPEIKSPAQQEQNSSICSAELPAASLYGVTPYAAWNPSLDSEENLSPKSKGNPSLDSEKETCMDSSLEISLFANCPHQQH